MPTISSTSIEFDQTGSEFTFRIQNQQANSQNISYTFSISDLDSAASTDFTLYLLCDKLDYSSLVVKSLNSVPLQNRFNSYYFYLSIKPLKYSLNSLSVEPTSSNISTITLTTISKEYYLVQFTISNIAYLVDNRLGFRVAFQADKIFNVQMEPIYKSSSFQQLSTKTSPSSISTFTQYGYGFSPVLLLNSNSSSGSSYVSWSSSGSKIDNGLLKLIGQTETLSTYILSLANINRDSSYQYSILYNNGLSIEKMNSGLSISTFNQFQQGQPPLGQLTLGISLTTLNFSSSKNSNEPYSISYYSFNCILGFPFGFIDGTNTAFQYRVGVHSRIKISTFDNNLYFRQYPTGPSVSYLNPYDTSVTDTNLPQVSFFGLDHVTGFKYLLKMNVSSPAISIYKLEYFKNGKIISNGESSLLKSDGVNCYYEFMVDIKYLISGGLKVFDYNFNMFGISRGTLLYKDSNKTPIYFDFPINDIDLDIENVILSKNDIDILDKVNYNTIYFNSNTIPHNYPLEFSLLDPVSLEDLNQGRVEALPILWSEPIKMFYCDFIVPKNTGPKFIQYKISTPFREIKSDALVQLRVAATNFDNDGPLIEKIENANSFGKVGWRLTITDKVNGFSNGYIKAIGLEDSSSFKFNFTLANVTTPSGTKFNGQYDIIINVGSRCITQSYIIEYIYLEDSNKRYSMYSKYDPDYLAEKDPLRYLLADIPSTLLMSTATCLNQIIDNTPPKLVSISLSSNNVDVGSLDRYVGVTFTAQDTDSGLMESQTPVVYLNLYNQVLECESKIESIQTYTATYSAQCLIPFGSKNLYVSVYGFINNGGYYSGYAPDDSSIQPENFISTFSSSTPLLLDYEPVYYYSKSDIIIYGRFIGSAASVSILYSNGVYKRSYINKVIGQSVIIIKRDDIDIVGPFYVTALNPSNSNLTNTIKVTPIYFEQSSTPEPVSTNSPQKCLGVPQCGGINNGYCVENQGCVCYSPWIGNDCLSRVLIVPQPTINDTVPTIEIPILDNQNSTSSSSTIFYKSLISIVSLREISFIDKKAIKDKSFNFERWEHTQLDSTTNQYFTKVSNVVDVIVTLKWFENATNIQFANQSLTMNPSSIKYTIEINNFPFENNLNTLELVMQASFLSNSTSDMCSSKEFGETSSGDNSNYLKIQIQDKSLYGRFIKRCIVDHLNIISLDNKVLDKDMNAILSPDQAQSYIGISIPNFKSKVLVDPDFSVIINPSIASSSSSNSICSNHSKSSKLSSTKLAGIIIGCIGFVCVVAAFIIYTIYKSKQYIYVKKDAAIELNNQN